MSTDPNSKEGILRFVCGRMKDWRQGSTMIVCKHCTTKNGIESRFCKSCGLELSDEDRDRARAELDKLVADGYSMLGQNRTEEAALVAERVLEENPDFPEALSLLGMCHERNLDSLAALECYERVVELRPDSALDKIKVQQLRNVIARGSKDAPKPNRAIALVGAFAAIVVVGSIGGIVATLVARPAQAASGEPTQTNQTPFDTFSKNELNVPKAETPKTQAPTNTEEVPPAGGVRTSNDGGLNRQPSGTAPNMLPLPGNNNTGGGVVENDGNKPLGVDLSKVEVVPNGGGTKPDPNEPDVEANKGGTRSGDVTEPEDPNKGIEIKVHKGQEPSGGSTPISEGGLTTLLKVAREQFMLGKYAQAASYYEKALAAGGDAGSVNQRLGQCYERLGRKGDAIEAYSRAETALRSGGSKAALEAVRQALQNLRGG